MRSATLPNRMNIADPTRHGWSCGSASSASVVTATNGMSGRSDWTICRTAGTSADASVRLRTTSALGRTPATAGCEGNR
jgi:hypothetical protein